MTPPVYKGPARLRNIGALTSGIRSIVPSPDAVYAGQSSSVVVTLANPAAAPGAKVLLSVDVPASASVPANATVAAGQTETTVMVSTVAGGPDATVTISASLEGATGRLSSQLRVVAVAQGPTLDSVRVPVVSQAWTPGTGTVYLSAPADPGGVTVTLSSNNPTVLAVPASVAIPAGQRSQTFALTGGSFSASGQVVISASYNAATQTATTKVQPGNEIIGLSGFPNTVNVGATVTGTVTIAGTAAAGGVTVPLFVRNPQDAFTVPSTLVIPAGQRTATLSITAKQTVGVLLLYRSANDMQNYQGGCGEQYAPCVRMQSAGAVILSDPTFRICTQNTSLCYVSTTTVEGGSSVNVDVGINGPHNDTTVVSVTSGNPAAAAVVTGSPVRFSGNYWYGAQVTVTAGAVTAATNVTLTVTCPTCSGTKSKTLQLQVVPGVTVTALTTATSDIKGGTSTTGTVTLNKPAGSGGAKVNLTSSNPSICGVPASITIPSGQSTGQFTVTAQKVLSNAAVTLGASIGGGAAKSASVRVVP